MCQCKEDSIVNHNRVGSWRIPGGLVAVSSFLVHIIHVFENMWKDEISSENCHRIPLSICSESDMGICIPRRLRRYLHLTRHRKKSQWKIEMPLFWFGGAIVCFPNHCQLGSAEILRLVSGLLMLDERAARGRSIGGDWCKSLEIFSKAGK